MTKDSLIKNSLMVSLVGILGLGSLSCSRLSDLNKRTEIERKNYPNANGYDVRLLKMGDKYPQIMLSVGNLKDGTREFEYPVLIAHDCNGDGVVDNFEIIGNYPAKDMKELASIDRLNKLEKELLK